MSWINSIFSDGSKIFLSKTNPLMGDNISIRIRAKEKSPIKRVFFRYLRYGEETILQMNKVKVSNGFNYYECNIVIEEIITQYHFIIETDDTTYFYNQKGIYENIIIEDYDFKIISNFKDVSWAREGIFYQIFVDRFFNGNPKNDVKDKEYNYCGYDSKKMPWNEVPLDYKEGGNVDFYGGDLEGIKEKINYLKDLGITALYLNPIFESKSNHKYDCDDYYNVDNHFGGDKALMDLTKALRNNNIKVIVDISINHTGIENNWVKNNKDFYFFNEDGTYESWNGVKTLPVLNYKNDDLKDVIYKSKNSVLKYWLQEPFNLDGWRLDVGHNVGKMKGQNFHFNLWRDIRKELKATNQEIYLVAEHWSDCKDYLQGDMWDSTMNYFGMMRPIRKYLGEDDRFISWKIDSLNMKKENGNIFKEEVLNHFSRIPFQLQGLQLNLLSSHDIHRIHTSNKLSQEDVLSSVIMLFTFGGIPCIYYGDEVGLKGDLSTSGASRYPMEWDDKKWDYKINNLYKKMIDLYKNEKVLQYGSFKFILNENDYIGYARFDDKEAILFINSRKKVNLSIELEDIGIFKDLDVLYGENNCKLSKNKLDVNLRPKESILVKLL
ncbi:MAG: alpha amylase N-terminal ig-like domain-containing protein [Clostridium sp.]|uniref:alpha amylase N-terminal ig-like domain-containing protein n=1 Tax=Clostridium sp. TaxID=1506 RepID=UPI001EB39F2F|nr:alpha amylase N-terminal ig-like domain-containing protein [Clostridium sp.]MBS5885312.1 alpha amylase N-terminal ig-like domain-containing protein [Clostridium sp.]MDU7149169.1 alpha amylase N-terminal ig-like domain-containing protein [Clostridium sp.]MDU7242824.1 alpha amylase N-terminal ig-like domain-containing protein [Clostridium sp.]